MTSASYMAQEIAALRAEIAELKGQRVTYMQVEVTSVNVGESTFGAAIPDIETGGTVTLTGIASPAQFLPHVGDTVTLALSGAQLVYQPLRIADGTVDSGQIAPGGVDTGNIADGAVDGDKISPASITNIHLGTGSVGEDNIAFNLWDFSGSYVYLSPTAPTVPNGDDFHSGDLWLQDTGDTGATGQPLYLTYRWDGLAWVLLQDQGISQALADAFAAQGTADTALTTAQSKITTYYQTSAPVSANVGDLWIDTDNGNQLYRYSGSSWDSVQDALIQAAYVAAGDAQATADGKIQTFAQTDPPANPADNLGVGDLWVDTDDSNKLYRWSGTSWVLVRDGGITTAQADAASALAAAESAQAAADGKVTAFFQTTAPTSGMADGDLWFDTDDSNKMYRFDGGTSTWVLSADTRISSAVTAAANAQATADGKIVTFYQTGPPSATAVGDLWVDTDDNNKLYRASAAGTGSWVSVQDGLIGTAISNAALAQTTADGKVTYFVQSTAPTYTGAANTAVWINTGNDNLRLTWSGSAWVARTISTGALTPNAIIASDVIATGTVTAALLEATLVLADQAVVAGVLTGDHSVLDQNGFHVFQLDPDGQVTEVGRLGTGADDFLGIGNASGQLVAAIDSNGVGSFTGLVVDGDPFFQGDRLSYQLSLKGGAMVASSYNNGMNIASITSRVGLGEVSFIHDANRSYVIHWSIPHIFSNAAGTRALMSLRWTGDGGSPLTTSGVIDSRFFECKNGSDYVYSPPDLYAYGNFPVATGSKIRVLACIEAYDGPGDITVWSGDVDFQRAFRMTVSDMGPNIPDTYIANTGAGGVTSKTTYDTGELAPAGHWSYKNGTGGALRTDTTDVVQGLDPSGFNGDGHGGWNFTIPNISSGATVNGVWLFLYANHTYFDSGGQLLLRLVSNANTANPTVLQTVYNPGINWPKPGGIAIQLPSSWNNSFKSKTSIGLYVGPGSLVTGGGTNELYYVRWDGPSARLRISYTQ
jgi:hypothetical protein